MATPNTFPRPHNPHEELGQDNLGQQEAAPYGKFSTGPSGRNISITHATLP